MGEYVDALNAIEVATISPDGSVMVSVKRQNETRIRLSESARSTHDETSLAIEIEVAVVEAWTDMKTSIDALNKRLKLPFASRDSVEEMRPELVEVFREIEDHETVCRSAKGNVEVIVTGGDEVFLSIENNIIRRTDVGTNEVELEIEEALTRTRRKFVRETKAMYRAKIGLPRALRIVRGLLTWITRAMT